MLERCHRKPRNGRRSAGAKHSLGYQFLGLSPKEALAERPLSVLGTGKLLLLLQNLQNLFVRDHILITLAQKGT